MFGYGELSTGYNNLITSKLEKGEKIIWQDQPQPYYFSPLSQANLWGGIVALFILSYVFFNIILSSFDFDDLNRITGVIIALFIVAFLSAIVVSISSPLRQYKRLTKTVYLLTDMRAMEIVVRRKPRIRSWPIDTITQIRLEEENVSLGSVEIVQGVRVVGDSSDTKGFFRIERASEVARLLEQLIDDVKPITTQEQTDNQFVAHTGSQRLSEESMVDTKKSFFMSLLDNNHLFRTVLAFLLVSVLFGTPAALGWITNTGTVG